MGLAEAGELFGKRLAQLFVLVVGGYIGIVWSKRLKNQRRKNATHNSR